MSAFVTLVAFVAQLQRTEVVHRPNGEEWAAMIARISVTGRIAVIDEEIYWYFLEVLPPKYVNGHLFAFAEARGAVQTFLEEGPSLFRPPAHMG